MDFQHLYAGLECVLSLCRARRGASLALRSTQCPSEGKVFQVFLDPPSCHRTLSCAAWILMFALPLACLCFCSARGSASTLLLITRFVGSEFTFSSYPRMWQLHGGSDTGHCICRAWMDVLVHIQLLDSSCFWPVWPWHYLLPPPSLIWDAELNVALWPGRSYVLSPFVSKDLKVPTCNPKCSWRAVIFNRLPRQACS